MTTIAKTHTRKTPEAPDRAKPARVRAATMRSAKKWSQEVTEHSDALTLEEGVFKQASARKIAESLKRSAEKSDRRKGTPFRSAMSMLNFYINRAGSSLSATERRRLDAAKGELRALFKRPARQATEH